MNIKQLGSVLSALCLGWYCLMTNATFAQSQTTVLPQAPPRTGTATISGRVTIGEEPAAGVTVIAAYSRNVRGANGYGSVGRAVTDSEGRYRLMNLPASTLVVQAFCPAYIVDRMDRNQANPGRQFTLTDGSNIENADISLIAGAVITGRVTDARNRPMIGRLMQLWRFNAAGKPERWEVRDDEGSFGVSYTQTDDRGIYRIYGLPAGRFLVGTGVSPTESSGRLPRRAPQLTYHPRATDIAEAKVIELTPGVVVENADITVSGDVISYEVFIQVVDSKTRQPVKGLDVVFERLQSEKATGRPSSWDLATDTDGRVLFHGVTQGRYAAYLSKSLHRTSDTVSYYSEPAYFEVKNKDVTDVVIEAKTGATVSGTASFGKSDEAASLARLAGAGMVLSKVGEDGKDLPGPMWSEFDAAAKFRFSGLQTGRYRLMASSGAVQARGLACVRLETKGALMDWVFELQEAQQVKDIRAVFVPAQGTIRGQVQMNQPIPSGLHLYVKAKWINGGNVTMGMALVGERNDFKFEKLPAGEYELSIEILTADISRQSDFVPPPFKAPKLRVNHTGEGEVSALMTLEFTQGGRQ